MIDPYARRESAITGRSVALRIDHSADVGVVRREADVRSREIGLDETERGRVSLIVNELGSNLLKHAAGGELVVSFVVRRENPSVEILALDRGPGIANMDEALRDGHSTSGTPGHGLGAIQRLSTAHDIYTAPDKGTAIFAEVAKRRGPVERDDTGAICVPVAGEHDCGDAWQLQIADEMFYVSVADGLGHGTLACEAANEAMRVFRESFRSGPADVLHLMHGPLRSTRGAAVAVAAVDLSRQTITYSGIGNIAARVIHDGRVQSLVSMSGTVGHGVERAAKEFRYSCESGSLLVLHSDGIATHWKLSDYPGLIGHHPSLIAAVLYRDHARGRDDATVVVANIP